MESDYTQELDSLVEDEWYIVRNSGEIPEIAYNSSIYFLERAKDGPCMRLSKEQKKSLQQAALKRCEEIVLRDMYHENIGSSSYRGVARSICNYDRFVKFCDRQNLDPTGVKVKAARLFSVFLQREYQNVSTKALKSVINCSYRELRDFASLLEVDFPSQYQLFQAHCLVSQTRGVF